MHHSLEVSILFTELTLLLLGSALLLGGLSWLLLGGLRSIRRPSSEAAPEEFLKREVKLERILAAWPHLRPEDREALEYMAENGGVVAEADLRDHFQLPRTTVWRMVKRLEREGVIEVRKVRGKNVLRVIGDLKEG